MKKNRTGLIVLGVVVVIVLLLGGWAIGSYNGLVSTQGAVEQARSDIDADLQRRSDLIPNLVNTVKGYAAHEEEVYTAIADARSKLAGAQTVAEQSAADNELTAALSRLLVVVENYPDLKANENFIALQDQLEGTENRIKVARTKYNDAAKEYNVKIKKFPTSLIAGMFGFESVEYFQASPGANEAPGVNFD